MTGLYLWARWRSARSNGPLVINLAPGEVVANQGEGGPASGKICRAFPGHAPSLYLEGPGLLGRTLLLVEPRHKCRIPEEGGQEKLLSAMLVRTPWGTGARTLHGRSACFAKAVFASMDAGFFMFLLARRYPDISSGWTWAMVNAPG